MSILKYGLYHSKVKSKKGSEIKNTVIVEWFSKFLKVSNGNKIV